jgi:hypothetical protein
MGQRRAARARRQDELGQARQLGVVVRQRSVQPGHGLVLEQGVAGDGELAAQVEQLVLDDDQQLAHIGRQRLGQQHAQVGVELVHIAHRGDAPVVLGHALAVAQPGGAIVAGAGGDLRESVCHALQCSELDGPGSAPDQPHPGHRQGHAHQGQAMQVSPNRAQAISAVVGGVR